MTERVDFYVLKSSAAKLRLTFACRLAEKAYLRDMAVVVLSDSDTEADTLDELLWTFSERSFVPHERRRIDRSPARSDGAPAYPAAVQLTLDLAQVPMADLLVNLGTHLPGALERFARVAEIIDGDADRRRFGRERLKAYRDLQLPVETHQLDGSAAAPSA
jgi:DNA polymerase III subunit chi